MEAMNTEDLFWLAINAYHEARGESDEGIKAVCHVVLNRCARRRKTIKEVVLQPYQFSWANDKKRPAISDYDSIVRCLRLAQDAYEDQELGKTLSNADHYYADYIQQPSWAQSMTRVCKIGKHIFYRS